MKLYELVLVIKSSLSSTQRKKLLEAVKGWLSDAKIVKEEEWGQKVLSYPIKREINGFYSRLQLEVKEAISSDFLKKLMTNENILRHLLLRKKGK